MALTVIDLLSSDDENESPNKRAKSALDSFAPRKDKTSGWTSHSRQEVSGSEEELRDPQQAARSALDKFAPSSNGGSARPNGERSAAADTRDSQREDSHSRRRAPNTTLNRHLVGDERSGTLAGHQHGSRFMDSTRTEQRPGRRDHANGSPTHFSPPATRSYASYEPFGESRGHSGTHFSPGRAERRLQGHNSEIMAPEAGSLAALLQTEQPIVPTQAAPPRPDTGTRPSSANSEGQVQPRFRFPLGWLSNQQSGQATTAPRIEPRLQIVDLFKKDQTSVDRGEGFGINERPLKRPRLDNGPQTFSIEREPFKLSSGHSTISGENKSSGDWEAPATSPEPAKVIKTRHDDLNHRPNRVPYTAPAAFLHSPNGAKQALAASQALTPPTVKPRDSSVGTSAASSSSTKRAKPFHLRHKMRLQPAAATDPLSVPPRNEDKRDPTASTGPSYATKPSLQSSESGPYGHANVVAKPLLPVQPASSGVPPASGFGSRYTPEEDALLAKLKEVDKMRFEDMVPYFNGRTPGSLQVRYFTKVAKRHQQRKREKASVRSAMPVTREQLSDPEHTRPSRKKRNDGASVADGMISWAEVRRQSRLADEEKAETSEMSTPLADVPSRGQFKQERAYPHSTSRILRQREIGNGQRRPYKKLPEELKEHVFDDTGPLRYHKGTSGDVTSLAWSPEGDHFAAGSIAITDERSMQYNRPGNLIVGDYARSRLQELPEHHLPRPDVQAKANINHLRSMRESQDPRLFMTVANVQFSPDSRTLYSAGTDAMVRAYKIKDGHVVHDYAISHSAPLDLLSVSNFDVLATGCHQSTDGSIGIYRENAHLWSLSPSRLEQQTTRAIFPSALRWGASHNHSNLLLAGFSIDSIDEERDIAGEACLWDVAAQQSIAIPVTRNVFDVAWNPRPTSTSTAFAVASTPGSQKVSKGTRTVVQCFAPNQGRASRVLEWECPAFDINDVVYCQHDDNLVAAGATDGKVYVWDTRFAGRRPTPLHVLKHGDSLNELDHDRPREVADTGIRFLSWGATSTRLYTGSSDGIVKTWNPYMATQNAHVKDVATFTSAVMSGAFSPDYRELLIGEDQGRINSLGVGHSEKTVRAMRKFEFVSAPDSERVQEDSLDAAHVLLRSQQIMLRPMGDLPTRQAVQGPNYAGPYYAPTAQETQEAQLAYELALTAARDSKQGNDNDATSSQAMREAEKQLSDAEEALARLRIRVESAPALHEQADANQRQLRRAGKERSKLEASLEHDWKRCKLDCNYLPVHEDEDEEVVDNGRSEDRIPSALRLLPVQDTMLLTAEELAEEDLMSKCTACYGPASRPNAGLPICGVCTSTRRGLTAKCSRCTSPIRPLADGGAGLCERCCFACLRCSRPARLSDDMSEVHCSTCGLTWTAGVLGYELDQRVRRKARRASLSPRKSFEFGEEERERLASRWGGGD